ncbi:MAG: hypothetical protein KDC61_23785, partial [Saprospiraceae bacterium]|nr:hypothetical protein [Saprospiraceae bacterium]
MQYRPDSQRTPIPGRYKTKNSAPGKPTYLNLTTPTRTRSVFFFCRVAFIALTACLFSDPPLAI